MTDKIAIIGSQTLGSPTEINEILHGKTEVLVVNPFEDKTATFKLEKIVDFPDTRLLPETRRERRKRERKNKKHR